MQEHKIRQHTTNLTEETIKKIDDSLAKLDNSQMAAVISESKNVAVVAPAGSGKTSTLVAAVAAYKYANPEKRVCAITYTRAARAEMQQRFRDLGLDGIEVSTIHVWSRDRLEILSRRYNFKIRILQEKEIMSILKVITEFYLRTSKVKSVNLSILYTYITGSKKMQITDNYRRTLNALETRYLKYKEDNGLYDFTDYPRYLWDMMKYYDEYITDIDALFVDEFQDVDPTQLEIFGRVLSDRQFVIGDEKQSIYAFRGADGHAFEKIDFFEKYGLQYNYRSYQEIIDYASAVYRFGKKWLDRGEETNIRELIFNGVDGRKPDALCVRGQGGLVSTIEGPEDSWTYQSGECHFFEQENSKKTFDNFMSKYKEPMILCRTNKQVNAIKEKNYFNVDTIHQAKGLEYNSVIVVDMEIKEDEDLHVAYVALTRARDGLMVIGWNELENYLLK